MDNQLLISMDSYKSYTERGVGFKYLLLDKNFNISKYGYESNAFENYAANKSSIDFKNGNGKWIDFYPNFNDEEKTITFSIKEEGKVKNNFKFGEWKYFNVESKIDSIKNYTLKDSIDVRFPHCIFNKNEPCY